MALKAAANPMMEKMHKALAYQKAGEFAKAQKIYKLVVKKLPNNADANHLLGVSYRQLGDPETAIKYIEKAISISPRQGVFYANLARAHSDLPNYSPETILINAEKALELAPTLVEAHNLKAIALTKLEREEEAEEIFKTLIAKAPNYRDAYRNYALLLRDQKREEEAAEFFDRTVKLEPENPENYVQRARARLDVSDYQRNKEELTEALKRFNNNSELQHEMARVLFSMGEHVEALGFAKSAHANRPTDPNCMVTLGVIYQMLGLFQKARELYIKAREYNFDTDASLDWNSSLCYLGLGDLKNGWRLHPARQRIITKAILKRQFTKPEWDGSDISDKTIMVWNDQGIGDAYRYGTLLPELIERSGKVIIELSQKMIPPFQFSFPQADVRLAQFEANTLKATLEDYDYHICSSDLGRFFRNNIQDFSLAKHPTFHFDRDLSREFYSRIPQANDKPIIGIAWRSRNLAQSRARFYLSAPDFCPILDTPGAIFLNLQYARVDREAAFLKSVKGGENFIDFGELDLMNDLQSAASLTACCDLVISANTSVADIAGCYNIPCWRFGPPEAIIMLGQDYLPWYPSTRLFPVQPEEAAVTVVPKIHSALLEYLEHFTPAERLKRLAVSKGT